MVIHTNENGLLDLDRSDTHIHNIEAKRCNVNNDSATYLRHCYLGHIGVKRMKKVLGNVVISKKFLRTHKIMVMHSNERGECCPRTLVDQKRKR